MVGTDLSIWKKLEEIKTNKPKVWTALVVGFGILALLLLLTVTGFIFPAFGSKVLEIVSIPVKCISGLCFGKKPEETITK